MVGFFLAMALPAIPNEINRHFEAALILSKREVLLRVLHEAELCLRVEQLATATILAGIVLEEACLLLDPVALEKQKDLVKIWREMRNRPEHRSPVRSELDAEQVKTMVTGIRAMLDEAERQQARSMPSPPAQDALTKTRGKYAFVQTSVDEFLKRKHQELDLEDQK
jgi:hypothetical protein